MEKSHRAGAGAGIVVGVLNLSLDQKDRSSGLPSP